MDHDVHSFHGFIQASVRFSVFGEREVGVG